MIEINNLTKRYGSHTVLDKLSLSIPKGKVISFIGPNGAGKSTLLGVISRLIDFDEGSIRIEGKELKDWESNELSKTLSILKQNTHVHMRLTVKDLVSFGRFPYSKGFLTAEDKEYIKQAIRYMNLEGLEDRYINELSGGQRQRALIAMVIAQNTDYILLDEPLNNLDMRYAIEMMQIVQDLCRKLNKTILIVVHDLNIASTYSDLIVALKDGKVVQMGDVQTMISKTILDHLYDMNFHIECINNRRFCVYYAM